MLNVLSIVISACSQTLMKLVAQRAVNGCLAQGCHMGAWQGIEPAAFWPQVGCPTIVPQPTFHGGRLRLRNYSESYCVRTYVCMLWKSFKASDVKQ